MFWRRHDSVTHRYSYIAVLEIHDRTDDRHLYGQRTFRFKLADGSVEDYTFEADEWQAWSGALGKGGMVINAR